MLDDLFQKPDSGMQVNFLKCLAVLPKVMRIYGNTVTPDVEEIAKEADEWVKEYESAD